MNRTLISTLLPALAVVPASYYITRPVSRPLPPPMASVPERQSPNPADNDPYTKDALAKCLNEGASYYKSLHRKEMDTEVTQWMMKIEPSLVVYVPKMNEAFINEMSYIKQLYIDSTNTNALSKYLLSKRMADALHCAKSPEELRMVQLVAKHYHLVPIDVRPAA